MVLTGRSEEFEEYRGRSAPDAALSGPKIDSRSDEEITTSISDYREYIFVSAVLSVIPPDQAVVYFDSVFGLLGKAPNSGKQKATREDYLNLIRMRDISVEQLIVAAASGHLLEKSLDAEARLEVSFKDTILQENEKRKLGIVARKSLANFAISPPDRASQRDREKAAFTLGELFDPQVPLLRKISGESIEDKLRTSIALYKQPIGKAFEASEIQEVLARSFVDEERENTERLIRRMVFGRYGNLKNVERMSQELYSHALPPKLILVGSICALLFLVNFVFIDANSTSIHAFYRDRLARAFFMKPCIKRVGEKKVDTVETDFNVKLSELCDYQVGGSVAPYHIINAALNMNHSGEDKIRNRNADFFIFSKLFVGGKFTGYMQTQDLEKLAPELTAASAMAISGAAVSANMGKYSTGIITFFLSILNIRLGYWIPNPAVKDHTITFKTVFEAELKEIEQRRKTAQANNMKSKAEVSELAQRTFADSKLPTVEHDFLGIALSGGGIRSAAFNLGILQVFAKSDFLREVDYLSTVSGGGYTGTATSVFMRKNLNARPIVEEAEARPLESASAGTRSSVMAQTIQELKRHFSWMPKSWLLYYEMFSHVNHRLKWVNVSDGGHIENLGVYELLRRRCRVIFIGDGEADPNGVFDGLSCLMRLAEIDMGIKINFPNGSLDFAKHQTKDLVHSLKSIEAGAEEEKYGYPPHFAIGTICYPKSTRESGPEQETGYLVCMKSSFQGNEDQIVKNYKQVNPSFPHETTADQLFDEGQFEAYRRLGFGIGKETLEHIFENKQSDTYSELVSRLQELLPTQTEDPPSV